MNDTRTDRPSSAPRRIPARPTVYNGIRMRSRLEATFAQQMDTWGWDWSYEPNCFASPDGQYLPDFLVTGRNHRRYIEVKPSFLLEDPAAVQDVQRRMGIIWASEPDAVLQVVFPETWHSYWAERPTRWFYMAPDDHCLTCDVCRLSQWPGKGCNNREESRLQATLYGWRMVDEFDYCPPCVASLTAECEAGVVPSEST